MTLSRKYKFLVVTLLDELKQFCSEAGLEPVTAQVSAIEKRVPNFKVLTLLGRKPS